MQHAFLMAFLECTCGSVKTALIQQDLRYFRVEGGSLLTNKHRKKLQQITQSKQSIFNNVDCFDTKDN